MRIRRMHCGDTRFSDCDTAKFLGYRTCAVADDWCGRDYRQRFFQKSGVLTDRSCFVRFAVFLRLGDGLRHAMAQYRRGKPHCATRNDCKQCGEQNSLPSKQAPTEQQKQERRDGKGNSTDSCEGKINEEQRAGHEDHARPVSSLPARCKGRVAERAKTADQKEGSLENRI